MKFFKFILIVLSINLSILLFLKQLFKEENENELEEDKFSNEEIHEILDFL